MPPPHPPHPQKLTKAHLSFPTLYVLCRAVMRCWCCHAALPLSISLSPYFVHFHGRGYAWEHYCPGCLFDYIVRMLHAWCRWDQPEGARAFIHMSMICHDELCGLISAVRALNPCWHHYRTCAGIFSGLVARHACDCTEGHLSFVWTS